MKTSKNTSTPEIDNDSKPQNFIRDIIKDDIDKQKHHHGKIATRFPPEPNGYLHIGHAKSICLNFGMAREFAGTCNLRFDDTNPSTEESEYVDSMKEDIRWLGFNWDNLYFASDYFEKLFQFAVELVKKDKAYVCDLSLEQIREYRGNFYKEGKDSPYRTRSVEENLMLLQQMKQGEFEEGSRVLRAKIDMKSKNLNLRDPILYRIRKEIHHKTGDEWCIYPMYDFAHCLSDSVEHITHSICTLEFEDHRPLYDWFLEQLDVPSTPQQIEFSRLSLDYTITSKRKLKQLVEQKHVSGWNDPRMPTLRGMRRLGYSPEAIQNFCERIGVSKRDSIVDITLLEHSLREHLNATSPRVMGVLKPLRIVIENYPEDKTEEFDAPYFPGEKERGTRKIPFSKVIYIEQDDFREDAPRKWFRLSPGKEIRLRYACLIKCVDVVKDDNGTILELRCTWDPDSRGGTSPDGRVVRGTSHWVSASHALDAEARLYDRLFLKANPLEDEKVEFTAHLNPNSLEVLTGCKVEPSLKNVSSLDRFQFERLGYFCVDTDSSDKKLVFNRTISLRDTWAKIQKSMKRK